MSGELEARLVRRADAAAVQRVMESNAGYSERVGGAAPGPDAVDELLTALPPGVDAEQKHVLGLWTGELLVAFADVIVGWPEPTTAHVGLLMTDQEQQGQGLGRRLHTAVLDLVQSRPQGRLRSRPRVSLLRVSIVDTNADEAEPFWTALGYRPTGDTVPYSSGAVESVARVWTRPVSQGGVGLRASARSGPRLPLLPTVDQSLQLLAAAVAQLRDAAEQDRDERRARVADRVEQRLAGVDGPRELRAAVADVMRIYQGGMGSFQDVGTSVMQRAVSDLSWALRRARWSRRG